MRLARFAVPALALSALTLLGVGCPPVTPPPGTPVQIPGLVGTVRVVTDVRGTPHIFAENDFDLARVQGFVHARDRFWQMDSTRREVSGDLAELLGPSAISGDIQNRTIGLRRAAERTFAALEPREKALLQAYADGVNAWLATNPLPPEYAALELTTARPWTPVDTLAIGKGIAASLSLDIDAGLAEKLDEYVTKGAAATPPFDGRKLLFEDVQRFAPMDPASTVPDAGGTPAYVARLDAPIARRALAVAAKAEKGVREKLLRSRIVASAERRREAIVGSNEWGVAASNTTIGLPIIANDPHLGLDWPSTFYENHLVSSADPDLGPLNVSGVTFPGIPAVILGQNTRVTWGATTNSLDVTDIFRDTLRRGAKCAPARFCIETEGRFEPVETQAEIYLANQVGDGVLDNVEDAGVPFEQRIVITVPFRSNGVVVDIDDPSVITGGASSTHALVLQYTGFQPTFEVRTFLAFDRANNVGEFLAGVQNFDFGSQNFAYADADGNLGYFSSAELPLRKDLEAGAVVGLPPYFVRDGSGPNNWVEDPAHSQGQAIPYAILPYEEMPQVLNPPYGFFVNSNNDPAGTNLDNDPLNQHRKSNPGAIYFLNGGYANGLRAGRITRLVRDKILAGERISVQDMRRFQGNTQELDAELLTPFLLQAFANASDPGAPPELAALASNPGVADAIARLSAWDYSTPTGIPEGYDATDDDGVRLPFVSPTQEANSVCATIYNVWRAKAIKRVIDATLSRVGVSNVGSSDALVAFHHLLARPVFTGVGASGVDFFPEPAALASAEDRRDAVLLGALADTLTALASDEYKPAFANSANPGDWKWGRLHRITFEHRLGGAFSVPPAGGFTDLAPDLPGLSRDGGYEVVNASSYGPRNEGTNGFRFGSGPVRRYVGAAGAGGLDGGRVSGWNVVAGGASAVPGDPTFASQLGSWLTVDQHPVTMSETGALRGALKVEDFSSPPAP